MSAGAMPGCCGAALATSGAGGAVSAGASGAGPGVSEAVSGAAAGSLGGGWAACGWRAAVSVVVGVLGDCAAGFVGAVAVSVLAAGALAAGC
jgi:hypothetical protein